jgi:acyl dehydratase
MDRFRKDERTSLADNGQQVAAMSSRVTGETVFLYESGKVLKKTGNFYHPVYAGGSGITFQSILDEVAPSPEWWIKLFVHVESLDREVSRYGLKKWRKRAGDKGVVIHTHRGYD